MNFRNASEFSGGLKYGCVGLRERSLIFEEPQCITSHGLKSRVEPGEDRPMVSANIVANFDREYTPEKIASMTLELKKMKGVATEELKNDAMPETSKTSEALAF